MLSHLAKTEQCSYSIAELVILNFVNLKPNRVHLSIDESLSFWKKPCCVLNSLTSTEKIQKTGLKVPRQWCIGCQELSSPHLSPKRMGDQVNVLILALAVLAEAIESGLLQLNSNLYQLEVTIQGLA
jgi:hypothetical protein